MGGSSPSSGALGRGEERTDSAKAKIKANPHMVVGRSPIIAASVQWNTVYLDRAPLQTHVLTFGTISVPTAAEPAGKAAAPRHSLR